MVFYWCFCLFLIMLVLYMGHDNPRPAWRVWNPPPPRVRPPVAPGDPTTGGLAVYCSTDPPAERWSAYVVGYAADVRLLGRFPSPLWAVNACMKAGIDRSRVELLSWGEDEAF